MQQEGYIFKVSVNYRREIYLHRFVEVANGDLKEMEDTPQSIALEKETEILPKLTSSLSR